MTLTSATGEVGTKAALGQPAVPLKILAMGVANVSALGDIELIQGDPDLQVGQIVSRVLVRSPGRGDGGVVLRGIASWTGGREADV